MRRLCSEAQVVQVDDDRQHDLRLSNRRRNSPRLGGVELLAQHHACRHALPGRRAARSRPLHAGKRPAAAVVPRGRHQVQRGAPRHGQRRACARRERPQAERRPVGRAMAQAAHGPRPGDRLSWLDRLNGPRLVVGTRWRACPPTPRRTYGPRPGGVEVLAHHHAGSRARPPAPVACVRASAPHARRPRRTEKGAEAMADDGASASS
jgi:hypothetical protein